MIVDDETPTEIVAFVAWMDQKIATLRPGLTENGVVRHRIRWLRSLADQAERVIEDKLDAAVMTYIANRSGR